MITRDSWIWWFGIAGAILTYLSSSEAPNLWHYDDWIKAISFLVATISGKLATSPLSGAKKNGNTN